MGKRPIQPKSSLSSRNKISNKEMYTKVWTAVRGCGLVAAAWPDGTERRVFCCAEGSGRKERVIDVPFFPYLVRKERVGIFFTRKAADRRSGAFVARR